MKTIISADYLRYVFENKFDDFHLFIIYAPALITNNSIILMFSHKTWKQQTKSFNPDYLPKSITLELSLTHPYYVIYKVLERHKKMVPYFHDQYILGFEKPSYLTIHKDDEDYNTQERLKSFLLQELPNYESVSLEYACNKLYYFSDMILRPIGEP